MKGLAKRIATRSREDSVDEGVALIELALVLLPVCLVVFGAVDLGRAYLDLTQLKNAARSGAFLAQSAPTSVSSGTNCQDPQNIYYQVANELGQSTSPTLPAGTKLTVTDLTSTVTFTGCGPDTPGTEHYNSGQIIQVEVSRPFKLFTPLISSIVGPLTLTTRVQVVAQCGSGTGTC